MDHNHRVSSLIQAMTCVLFLSAATEAADKIVACVGNSITYGYDLPRDKAYPTVLDSLLGSGHAVSNFGVSSKTMAKGSNESYWKESAYTSALASKPDIVVIELGTNDAKPYIWDAYGKDFQADYKAMIQAFRTLPTAPEVWITLQPWANNESWGILDNALSGKVNPAILEVAKEAGAPLIDLRAGFVGHKEWYMADSVHPNATGAKALAGLVAKMLQHQPLEIRLPAVVGGRPQASLAGVSYQWYRNDTLLAGDTSQTLRSTLGGRYKVAVKLERASENRLVSGTLQLSGISRNPQTRLWLEVGPSGRIRLSLPGQVDASEVDLRDLDGRRWSLESSLPRGIYVFSVRTRGVRERGTLVVP